MEIALKSRKAKALLVYLAQPIGKPRSREEITALLWSDRGEEQGRASLRQVLAGLRRELGEGRTSFLRIDRDSVALDPELIGLTEPNGEEFLAGFQLNDPAFEDWLRDMRLAAEDEISGLATTSQSANAYKPSIAVLPFTNLSQDSDQEYFSDGITEDIITELNRFQSFLVISSTSSFIFRGQEVDPVEVGQKLGVEFIVKGSVRKAGKRLRISVQLIDAKTADHLWSERYDRNITDLFALQDEIAATVTTMVSGHVDIANRAKSERKHPKDINAYDLVLRASWYIYTDLARTEIFRLLEQAIELDPTYATAHAKLAIMHSYSVFLDALPPDEILPLVKKHGSLAAQLSPGDAMVHGPLAEAYGLVGEHQLAEHHLERALSINPNHFEVMACCAEAAALLGESALALDLTEKARMRDPYSSLSFRESWHDVFFLAGRYEDALAQFVGWPNPPFHMCVSKAATLVFLGRIPEARRVVQQFEAQRPKNWDVAQYLQNYRQWCQKPEDGDRWMEGFRKAGLNV